MAIAIGILLVIVTIVIVGLIYRKRVYEQVDQYESWKLDIMNRNVASQLAKIKSLNLSGEAQRKFDSWKERWDNILTKDLPDVEELLFDAEAFADKYRFSKARDVLATIEQELNESESTIESMLAELDDLLTSAEKSEEEVGELQPLLKVLERKVTENRSNFGESSTYFLEELKTLDESLHTYFEMIEAGNYMEAQSLVDDLKPRVYAVEKEIEKTPKLYVACENTIPKELNTISSGLEEMEEQGYYLGHLSFEKDIERYKLRLEDCIKSLDKGVTAEVEEAVETLEQKIQEMYDTLEKEALSKTYVEDHINAYGEKLLTYDAYLKETKADIERLKPSYRFDDYDLQTFSTLEKTLNKLMKQKEESLTFDENEEKMEQSYAFMKEEIEKGYKDLEQLDEDYEAFIELIERLSKDEVKANEQLEEIREEWLEARRKLHKSNLPGIPTFIKTIMETVVEKYKFTEDTLSKQPLDMNNVKAALEEARKSMDHLNEQTELIIDQAYLTERVIQYSNRYRSQNEALAEQLEESERLFRAYEYELALEQAATAIEAVEPGALKRIESLQ
ncbi:MAG TPA: septation ring formation regulator EzrA [Bacillota bacterium]|nr:septation ring formation regulator EzrA [Bacillota bacterium]